MSNELTRRSFVKWGTATAGATALAGLTSCAPAKEEELSETGGTTQDFGYPGEKGNGQWLTGACMNNCSCEHSRCLLRVYVEDGVPLRIRTDEEEDSIEVPQRRACPRGRAQISNMTSPARIKYPMKRKGWSPDAPNGEMRGRDEWERISWDEALDYIAAEMQKAYDNWGPKSILAAAYSDIGEEYFDPIVCLLNAKGGAVHHDLGTVSLGSWPCVELFMTGSIFEAPDALSLAESQLHFHFGNNWAANKAGNTSLQLNYAKEQGGRLVIIDPWLNQTAAAIADEWVPILPGTDTAFCLGMMYHQVENNLQNQEFLDTYCVGFDAEHMPEGADPKENFKDYLLGTYDGEPKTPEWAEAICGVPAATTPWPSCTAWEPRATMWDGSVCTSTAIPLHPTASRGMPPTVPARTLSTRWLPRSSCLCPIGLKLPTKTPGKRWTTPSAGSPFSTGPTDATPGPAARSPLTSTSSTRAATRTV